MTKESWKLSPLFGWQREKEGSIKLPADVIPIIILESSEKLKRSLVTKETETYPHARPLPLLEGQVHPGKFEISHENMNKS